MEPRSARTEEPPDEAAAEDTPSDYASDRGASDRGASDRDAFDRDAPGPLFASNGAADDLLPLEPSVRTLWSIKLGAFAAVVTLAVLIYDLTHLFADDNTLPVGVLSAAVALVLGGFALGWPRLRYRTWRFALRPEEIYLTHGVITHVRTLVPLRRVQHLDVSQDLFEREFGLGRLVVHTAGSRSSDVQIPGLKLDEAERIRDEVKRFILEDPLMEDPV
jgi:hypothetical protein